MTTIEKSSPILSYPGFLRRSLSLATDGSLEIVTLRSLLESQSDVGAGRLDFGLLKPIYRRTLTEDGRLHFPEHARHGADFLGYFDLLLNGARFGLLREAHYVFSARIGEISGVYSPGSVTPVDYRAIAANLRRLDQRLETERPEAPDLPVDEMRSLIDARVAQLDAANRTYGWNTLWTGAWSRHLAWLRTDRRNVPLLASMAVTKLLRGRWLVRRVKGVFGKAAAR